MLGLGLSLTSLAVRGRRAADLVALELSSISALSTVVQQATLSFITNEGTGTAYWVVTKSGTPPTAAQVIAGEDELGAAASSSGSQAISSSGAQNITATGLTDGAADTYYGYIVHQDSAANNSAVAETGEFAVELAANGTFSAAAPPPIVGTGWTVSGGAATHTVGAAGLDFGSVIQGETTYRTSFEIISVSASFAVIAFTGGTTKLGTNRSTVGVFTEDITTNIGNTNFVLAQNSSFAGVVDNVSCKLVVE